MGKLYPKTIVFWWVNNVKSDMYGLAKIKKWRTMQEKLYTNRAIFRSFFARIKYCY